MAPTIITPPFQPTPILSRLLLGTLWNAKKLDEIRMPVGLILNCTDETIPKPTNVPIIQLGLLDGYEVPFEKLQYSARIIKQFFDVDYQRAVLVCCHASQSRSPAIVLTYLLSIGMGFDEAYGLIRTKHPRIQIAPMILKSVRQLFGYAPRSAEDLIQG